MEDAVLRCSSKFHKLHRRWSLFSNKVAGWAYILIKKETPSQFFSCKVCEIFKNTFFPEHILATSSAVYWKKFGTSHLHNTCPGWLLLLRLVISVKVISGATADMFSLHQVYFEQKYWRGIPYLSIL